VPTGDVVADLTTAMARQGFDPETRTTPHGAEVVLHRCPFANAALADRTTVCALHLGIAKGLASHSAATVEELVAYDPRDADCRIRIRLGPAGSDRDEGDGVLTLRGRRKRRSVT
jgi:predicted ArsR family transcriptional regulator